MPQPRPVHVAVAARTAGSPERDGRNEDALFVRELGGRSLEPRELGARPSPERPLGPGLALGIFDGMGGMAAGHIASATAARVVSEVLAARAGDPEGLRLALGEALGRASHAVAQAVHDDPRLQGVGTCATVVLAAGGTLLLGHVGDSRVYLLRAGRLVQITRDHSLEHALVEAGELEPRDAPRFAHKGVVMRTLGYSERVHGDFDAVALRRGDVFLLCTPGVYGAMGDGRLAELLEAHPDPAEACEALVSAAHAGRASYRRRDATALVARFGGEGLPPPGPGELPDDRNALRPPSGTTRVTVAARTDVGTKRVHNEDAWLVGTLSGIEPGELASKPARPRLLGRGFVFGVFDGCGGMSSGRPASDMAKRLVYETLWGGSTSLDEDPETIRARLEAGLERASAAIFEAARSDPRLRGMGTTATLAVAVRDKLLLAQVGDSRAYVLRRGRLTAVTRDQTLLLALIDEGKLAPEDAADFPHQNVVLQALGVTEELGWIGRTEVALRRGDVLLLATDGLYAQLDDATITRLLEASPDPAEACEALVAAADDAGGHDNVTVVVARFDGETLAPPSPSDVLEDENARSPSTRSGASRVHCTRDRAPDDGGEEDESEDDAAPEGSPKSDSPGRRPLPFRASFAHRCAFSPSSSAASGGESAATRPR